MEFLTGKHIPRRTFLRDASAIIGLPMLDAMVPARLVALWAQSESRLGGSREAPHGKDRLPLPVLFRNLARSGRFARCPLSDHRS